MKAEQEEKPKNLPDRADYVALQQGNECNNITNENETALLFFRWNASPLSLLEENWMSFVLHFELS